MLTPPNKGFGRSISKHNIRLDAFAEWIEGCITFVDDRITKTEIVDVLIEESYYRSQDFAKTLIGDGWKELIRRKKCLGEASSYDIGASAITRSQAWDSTPAYSFCLMLSLQVAYRDSFTTMFGSDYTEQGILFERLTGEALEQMGWKTHSAAWSKTSAKSIKDKVEALATHLGEPRCTAKHP